MFVFMHIAKVLVHNRFKKLTRLNRFTIIEPSIRLKEMAVCFFVKVKP